ncbi:MAG: aconitate hydratase AcnA [Candidatus Sumerlaeia bacterium]|nr:aconitate hydratase AcnA [Candidatus Sumerlaeia bacterium]
MSHDSFSTQTRVTTSAGDYAIRSLPALERAGVGPVSRLPFSLKVLLENLLRHEDGIKVSADDIRALANWDPKAEPDREIAFTVARVLLQDFTGVPAVVDLAGMRDALRELGGDPEKINPVQPVDLVIDHSVQVDEYGKEAAFLLNVENEYQRNVERYSFLRWGQKAFANFSVVPPGTGICHQVNIEHLAQSVIARGTGAGATAFPDTLVGTDSHTPMVNALGVVGWGVGGIEAEAAMLGQPISMLIPQVVGFEMTGTLPAGATATDLVLTVVNILRKKGVVGKFVEFYGDGLAGLSVADRATISNMAPEYGATIGFFPVDERTLEYLRFTGRTAAQVELVEKYCRAQGLFRVAGMPAPAFTDTVSLDLATVVPSISGPKRPQDKIALSESQASWRKALETFVPDAQRRGDKAPVRNGVSCEIGHGNVVIAAITSCTNTSNPSVMIAAGLVARKARARGLRPKPWVKTSLAPGSKVVTEYLNEAGLSADLDAVGFHLVGYGCTTCIGNSGPLPQPISEAIHAKNLVAVAVLSGNRNFEGRISPDVKANYLASPPLVVAYALAGTMDIDLQNDPIGKDARGKDVFLRDIWPTPEEVQATIRSSVHSEMFEREYADVFKGDARWQSLPSGEGQIYDWQPDSTYVRKPPFFEGLSMTPAAVTDIRGARCLALLGDSVTTDHISPAGSISKTSPAARYLIAQGVEPKDFNSYGARRGNHEVMMRGTFANIRLRNQLIPGSEGGVTLHLPAGEQMSIYDAAMKYKEQDVPLVVVAGKEYGSGSSRDWAAKGTRLLGVRAVLAESYERIHRSNLVGMGVLPLEFVDGANAASLGLTGREVFDIAGLEAGISPRMTVSVTATDEAGRSRTFTALVRIDTPNEVDYYCHGGILQYVLRQLAKS